MRRTGFARDDRAAFVTQAKLQTWNIELAAHMIGQRVGQRLPGSISRRVVLVEVHGQLDQAYAVGAATRKCSVAFSNWFALGFVAVQQFLVSPAVDDGSQLPA